MSDHGGGGAQGDVGKGASGELLGPETVKPFATEFQKAHRNRRPNRQAPTPARSTMSARMRDLPPPRRDSTEHMGKRRLAICSNRRIPAFRALVPRHTIRAHDSPTHTRSSRDAPALQPRLVRAAKRGSRPTGRLEKPVSITVAKAIMEADKRVQNATLNIREYTAGIAILESLPRFLLVELTQGCNLACPMCRPKRIATRERTMTDELFERVASTLFPTAEVIDLRGWGESVLLPSFAQSAQRVFDSGALLRIVTNLAYPRLKVLSHLIQGGAWLDLSIDTLDEEAIRVVRPGARLDLIRGNLRHLIQLRHTTAKGRLRVLLTIQQPGLQSLRATVLELLELGIKEFVLTPVRIGQNSPVSLAGCQAEVLEHLAWIETATAAHGARSTLGGVVAPNGTVVRPEPCIHPWSHAYVRFDGAVGYCDHLIGDFFAGEILGTLLADPFPAVWNGEEWQQLRRDHAERRTSPSCWKNCHKCYRSRPIDYEGILFSA